jgi:hypothetical protein
MTPILEIDERLFALRRPKKSTSQRISTQPTQISVPGNVRLLEAQLGCKIGVREIRPECYYQEGSLDRLTPAILSQLMLLKLQFNTHLPYPSWNYKIRRIDYIMNDTLYERFNSTKKEFHRLRRDTSEVLLFHGTNSKNLTSYPMFGESSHGSIISGGFKIGGEDGHPVAHGRSMVPPHPLYIDMNRGLVFMEMPGRRPRLIAII